MSNFTTDIEKQIAEKEAEIAELKKRAANIAEMEKNEPEKLLAEQLHGMLCNFNHTDGCSWHYEVTGAKTDWNGWAHAIYLKKAKTLMSLSAQLGIDANDAIRIFKIVKAL